jgi:hypothetical protein
MRLLSRKDSAQLLSYKIVPVEERTSPGEAFVLMQLLNKRYVDCS